MSTRLPIVSIAGRQNVGKSTLFNTLIKERRAIVDSHPGLTRDILSFTITHGDTTFILSDTPGLDISTSSELSQNIIDVAQKQLERSSLILLLLENPAPAPFDFELVRLLRRLSIPIIAAVNKMDGDAQLINISQFYETGLKEIIPISALRKKNISLLLDKITENLPKKQPRSENPDLKIAIVGRPNSGKSTLLNSFLGYNRAVVSDMPGTTRDSVDDEFIFHGRRICITDTAGLRKKSRVNEDIEFYSMTRTIETIKNSQVVIHMIDATLGLTENDKKISDEILKAGKNVIIAVNKWDAIEKDHTTFAEFREKVIFKYYRAGDFPIISISAKNRTRIHKLIQTALDLYKRSTARAHTPLLNRALENIQKQRRNPLLGESLRIYYGAQTGISPPTFKLFVNRPELFKKDIIRYIQKSLEEALDLKGIPIFIEIAGRGKTGEKNLKKNKKSN